MSSTSSSDNITKQYVLKDTVTIFCQSLKRALKSLFCALEL